MYDFTFYQAHMGQTQLVMFKYAWQLSIEKIFRYQQILHVLKKKKCQITIGYNRKMIGNVD